MESCCQAVSDRKQDIILNLYSKDGWYPRIYIQNSLCPQTLLLQPPLSVAATDQINNISHLFKKRRKMNVLTRGKSVGITRQENAEVHMTNLLRFRNEHHLHNCWLQSQPSSMSTKIMLTTIYHVFALSIFNYNMNIHLLANLCL